jgi:RNA polymerase sigma-70 factor, ECF subfamily
MMTRSIRASLTADRERKVHRRPSRTPDSGAAFRDAISELFTAHFPRIYRFLHRLSGEPDVAADIAQEAFVRLHERGSLPDEPASWLVTVALNRFRNVASSRSRRIRLLTADRAAHVLGDPPASPAEWIGQAESRARVRAALEQLPERDRQMLLLCAEGYRYREIATALGINEASVGTLLSRAKRAFRAAYGDDTNAS